MGPGLGICVGLGVGGAVGDRDGARLGVIVGGMLGAVLGTTVGGLVGIVLGITVGRPLGAMVGVTVGLALGTTVGDWLGAVVGMTVGVVLGVVVGVVLGMIVGEVLGRCTCALQRTRSTDVRAEPATLRRVLRVSTHVNTSMRLFGHALLQAGAPRSEKGCKGSRTHGLKASLIWGSAQHQTPDPDRARN